MSSSVTLSNLGWCQDTIQKILRNVVAIRFCRPCSFDTNVPSTGDATGFVVDSEKGYILTNRHVVSPGPMWGRCIFNNQEETNCYPMYRDPVHDFGFLRYDPKAIKSHIDGLRLCTNSASVGMEILLIGNDAGEKLSILSGVISRLDRNAPEYDMGRVDFNTNYYQANAAATGGSSGSPVVGKNGSVVAMQVGGRSGAATTKYFLPLDRPLRALQHFQKGESVIRGDIQCMFLLKSFEDCRRLGLTRRLENEMQQYFPGETNMLVAEVVLPTGPSDGKIVVGDILVRINGKLISNFAKLEEILDSNVGGTISVVLQRESKDIEVEIGVEDLHRITPDRFVSVAGSTFHQLSYIKAMVHGVAPQGVFVCGSAGSFKFGDARSGCVVETIDGKQVPDLEKLTDVAAQIPDQKQVVVTYKRLNDPHTLKSAYIRVNYRWNPVVRMVVRNDEIGLWKFCESRRTLPVIPTVKQSAIFVELNQMPGSVQTLPRSFVQVDCTVAMKLDGYPQDATREMGLVVSAEEGLVLVSRAIVPYDFCVIAVTIAESIVVEAKVVFLHPLQNYSIIKYDPALVDAPVESAKLSENRISQGTETYFVGFKLGCRLVHGAAVVREVVPAGIPINHTTPRYRTPVTDAILIDSELGSQCRSGALCASDGTIEALWLTYLGEQSEQHYSFGTGTTTLPPVISAIKEGRMPDLRLLSVEFEKINMVLARGLGVSGFWIGKACEANPSNHQLFQVRRRTSERTKQSVPLLVGDVVLTLNGKICTTLSDFDIAYSEKVLSAVIVREGMEIELDVDTVAADQIETDHVVLFCGMVLQRPHLAVRQLVRSLPSEVYISGTMRGSPASMNSIKAATFITAVNGTPTLDLKSFITATKTIPDNSDFRMRAEGLDNQPRLIILKKMDHYFPMTEWIKDPEQECGWRRATYKGNETSREESGIPLVAEFVDTK